MVNFRKKNDTKNHILQKWPEMVKNDHDLIKKIRVKNDKKRIKAHFYVDSKISLKSHHF